MDKDLAGPANAESLLADLNREFVLLDHDTFQSFISERDLERGRSFAGLLGLKQYSDVRQQLQALANTRRSMVISERAHSSNATAWPKVMCGLGAHCAAGISGSDRKVGCGFCHASGSRSRCSQCP